MNEKSTRQPMDGKWSVVWARRIDAVAGLNGYQFNSYSWQNVWRTRIHSPVVWELNPNVARFSSVHQSGDWVY